MDVKPIKLSLIDQNENSRTVYKSVDLAELMASMRQNGLLEPIGVMPIPKSSRFEVVYGNRRLISAAKLGWNEIPAVILDLDNSIDRDILGLVENMKRKNTSVQEDGRIFQSLKDRGLSKEEIAARLDISIHRVTLALEVLRVVPQEYRTKITNIGETKQKTPLKGQIAASVASTILNLRRKSRLNRKQTRSVFKYAAENQPSVNEIYKIGPLLKEGFSVDQAISKVKNLDKIVLTLFMPMSTRIKLEKKYKKTIHKQMYEALSDCSEFKIVDFGAKSGQLCSNRRTVEDEVSA